LVFFALVQDAILGVAEFRYEKLEGRVGRERITVCCENGESYINSATPNFATSTQLHDDEIKIAPRLSPVGYPNGSKKLHRHSI
jgi:hypothetical protein